jgi:hypothetical protein
MDNELGDILCIFEGAPLIGEPVDKQLGSPAVYFQEIFHFLDKVLSVHRCFGFRGCVDIQESAVDDIEMVGGPLKRMDSETGISNDQVPEGPIWRSSIVHRVSRRYLSLTGGCWCLARG